jgi:hypothetical protein
VPKRSGSKNPMAVFVHSSFKNIEQKAYVACYRSKTFKIL